MFIVHSFQREDSHYCGLSLKGPFGVLEHVVKVNCP